MTESERERERERERIPTTSHFTSQQYPKIFQIPNEKSGYFDFDESEAK